MAKPKPEIIGSSVVRFLREKRVAKGLSMYVVAKRARLSHSMISRVEHELRRPTLDTLLRITEAMEIDLWPLLKMAEREARHDFKPHSQRSPNPERIARRSIGH